MIINPDKLSLTILILSKRIYRSTGKAFWRKITDMYGEIIEIYVHFNFSIQNFAMNK